jgi:hypothetical protein
MKKTLKIMAATLALLMSVGVAHATGIAVVNDGTGTYDVSTFDWNVGNALAYQAIPLTTGSAFTLYYQAALAGYNDINGDSITGTGLNTAYELTIVAAFGEKASVSNGGLTANFSFDATNPNNYLYVYKDTTKDANSLNGTGYTDGDLILRANISALTSSNFNVTLLPSGAPSTGNLDAFGTDNWAGQQTVKGSGATDLTAIIDWYDPTFFENNIIDQNILVSLFFNTSNVLPYNQTNPSKNFNLWNGVDFENPAFNPYGIVGTLGAINGLGTPGQTGGFYNMLFQADANQSFGSVPEPSTMLLTGLGLVLAGCLRRRARK